MCLYSLYYNKKFKKEGEGWKIFSLYKGDLVGKHRSIRTKRPRRRWLNEKDFREYFTKILASDGFYYPTGWHILLKYPRGIRSDCDVIKKVKYRKAQVVGTQFYGDISIMTVVAKEMLIK